MPSAKCYLLDEGRHPAKFAMKSCLCGIGYQSGMDAVLSRTKGNLYSSVIFNAWILHMAVALSSNSSGPV